MSTFTKMLAGAAFVAGVTLATQASAWDKHVEIVNSTGYQLRELYATNSGSPYWGYDHLGRYYIAPGSSYSIDFNDGSGRCLFDFKAVFEDGTSVVRNGVNVCQITSYTYY